MKLSVNDVNVLKSLSPNQVLDYLKSQGWVEFEHLDGKSVILTLETTDHEEFEVAVPLKRDFRDFGIRMSELLETLEIVEDRSQFDILQDIETVAFDILRFRIDSPHTRKGKISFYQGLNLTKNIKNLVTSVASSTVFEPKPYFLNTSNLPKSVQNCLEQLEIGHERGSYVVSLLSPIPQQFHLFDDEPFSRKSFKKLLSSVHLAVCLADEYQDSHDFDIFLRNIDQGISANLCDSVAGLAKSAENYSVEILVSWSFCYQKPQDIPERVLIEPRHVKLLEEAAKYLKSISYRDFEITGVVVRLSRLPESQSGSASIQCFIEGEPQEIKVTLNESDYNLATEAHKSRDPVNCRGDLVGKKNSLKMENIQCFRLANQ